MWFNVEILIPQNVLTLRLPWINPRLDMHMLSFLFPLMSHWVKFNPNFGFLSIISVDCASEFTCLEMTLFAGRHWVMLPKQISAAQLEFTHHPPTDPTVPTHLKAGSVQCSQPITQLKGFFFIYIYFVYTLCAKYLCVCCVQHCDCGYAIQIWWSGRGSLRMSSQLLHWPSLVSLPCPLCKNVLPR